jgi:long-subunit fatty acid transport protein
VAAIRNARSSAGAIAIDPTATTIATTGMAIIETTVRGLDAAAANAAGGFDTSRRLRGTRRAPRTARHG